MTIQNKKENAGGQFGLFGDPVAHSLSPQIYAEFSAQCGIPMRYDVFQVSPEKLADRFALFVEEGGEGLNITVPHKIAIKRFVTACTDRARLAGAVNTIKFARDGMSIGDNTDGAGLMRDLLKNLGWVIGDARILLLGAGGAARGLLFPLLSASPSQLLIANRTEQKAVVLAQEASSKSSVDVAGCGLDALAPEQPFDVIINATSASLQGDLLALPEQIISPDTCCYDLVYRADRTTPFLEWARHQGVQHRSDGWGMLVEQAAEAFRLWHGVRPDTQALLTSV